MRFCGLAGFARAAILCARAVGAGRLAPTGLLIALLMLLAPTTAAAQYSLGTNYTPFDKLSQTVTLSYYLTNFSGADATVTASFATTVSNPSCASPISLLNNTTLSCTVSYAPTAQDVAADKLTVASNWSFCSAATCSKPETISNVLPVFYTGPPLVTGASVAVPFNSSGVATDLSGNVTGLYSSLNVATAPAHGTATVTGNKITYIPTAGYYGADSYTFSATGAGGVSLPAIVTVVVANPPAPVATATSVNIAYNSPGTAIDLTSKIAGVATSAAVASAPGHGTVTLTGLAATYIPTNGYIGPDSFAYTAIGPGGTSVPAVVSITVVAPTAPTVANVSIAVPYNSAGQAIDLTSKISGIVTTITVATTPAHGTTSASGFVVTYKPTAGYSGTDSFTYTATGPGGTSAPGTVSITIAVPPQQPGTLTVSVTSPDRDGTFGFASSVAGASTFALATSAGVAARSFTGLTAGTYSLSTGTIPGGVTLHSGTCSGSAALTGSMNVTVPAGGAVTCAFVYKADKSAAAAAESATIRNFMSSRARALTSNEPDTERRHARLPGALNGDGDEPAQQREPVSGPGAGGAPRFGASPRGAGIGPGPGSTSGEASRFAQPGIVRPDQPFSLSGTMDDNNGRMAFGTSLSQMSRSAKSADDARRMGLGGNGPGTGPTNTIRPVLFDIWVEANTTRFSDNTGGGKRAGSVDLVYIGADYVINRAVLIGALVQFDRAKEQSSVLGTSAEGKGWMAGPYMTARLTKNIYFDARAAWGQSNNTVSPFAGVQDSYATSRQLYTGKLSGNWYQGALRVSPSVDLTYYSETQNAFTSTSGAAIAAQTLALGRLTFGPEFGYRFKNADGSVFEPFTSLKAVWDFKRDTTVSIGGMDVGTSAIRGKAELGASYTTSTGISVKGSASYDGIGDKNFQAYGGRLSIHVPLQ